MGHREDTSGAAAGLGGKGRDRELGFAWEEKQMLRRQGRGEGGCSPPVAPSGDAAAVTDDCVSVHINI